MDGEGASSSASSASLLFSYFAPIVRYTLEYDPVTPGCGLYYTEADYESALSIYPQCACFARFLGQES